ncbi:MAG: carbohydrate kinase family protein [Atribacterota bacterium]|nr:carbohydrate kinase family protein [Atribacterota bacterium]
MKAIGKENIIYGFGSATLDFRIQVPDLGYDYKDKLLAQKTDIFGGGAVANCLIQVARLGRKTSWLGKLGDDWIGHLIQEQLNLEKVDCSNIIWDESVCSPFNLAVYAGEEKRRIGGFLIPNSLAEINLEDISSLSSNIEKDNWIIVEVGEIPLDITLTFCQQVKKIGAKLLVDIDLDPIKQCNGNRDIVRKIIAQSDFLIPNYYAMSTLYPDIQPKELTKKLAWEFEVNTIITVGPDGVYYCEPGKPAAHQQAFKVKVIDTVGAGDAFHGGLLFGLAGHWSLAKSVELGARCGAYNCQKFGAREGMPTSEDLNI